MVRKGRILWDNPAFCRSESDRLRRLDAGDDSSFDPRLRERMKKNRGERGNRRVPRPIELDRREPEEP